MRNGLLIQGDNVHVYKFIGVVPFEVVCAIDCVYEETKELIGSTTPDSGKWFEVRPRLRSSSLSLTGATTSDNDSDISIFHFFDEDVTDEAQDLQIVFTDNDGSERTIRGFFYVEKITLSNPTGENATYDILLRGSGEITKSELVDPTVTGESVGRNSYTVAGGIVSDPAWIGLSATNIIGVWREGTELTSMGLSYTVNFTLGTITPDSGTTIDGQKVFVIWTY